MASPASAAEEPAAAMKKFVHMSRVVYETGFKEPLGEYKANYLFAFCSPSCILSCDAVFNRTSLLPAVRCTNPHRT